MQAAVIPEMRPIQVRIYLQLAAAFSGTYRQAGL